MSLSYDFIDRELRCVSGLLWGAPWTTFPYKAKLIKLKYTVNLDSPWLVISPNKQWMLVCFAGAVESSDPVPFLLSPCDFHSVLCHLNPSWCPHPVLSDSQTGIVNRGYVFERPPSFDPFNGLWPLLHRAASRLNLLPNPGSSLRALLSPLPQPPDTFACC